MGIEAVGAEPALHNLVNNIEKGGQVLIVGVYEESPRMNMGFVGEHELTVQGSKGLISGTTMPRMTLSKRMRRKH